MTDAREVITAAMPCNIVYGRQQAADGIIRALTAVGFRILGPDEVDAVTVERAAEICERPVIGFQDGAVEASRYYAAIIRALASGESR